MARSKPKAPEVAVTAKLVKLPALLNVLEDRIAAKADYAAASARDQEAWGSADFGERHKAAAAANEAQTRVANLNAAASALISDSETLDELYTLLSGAL